MIVTTTRSVAVERTYPVARALALFNVDPGDTETFTITADVPIETEGWKIGAIVGPSGSGKTSLVDALKERGYEDPFDDEWHSTQSILDGVGGDFEEATGALASVGLGSVPAWVRPHRVLSNGEQFRANLARALVARHPQSVIDEFTSVVDRRVACIGAAAFAKAWRRGTGQVIVVAPHYDILPWIKPDWVVRTSSTGPTVTDSDWDKIQPEVIRDPAAPVIGTVVV